MRQHEQNCTPLPPHTTRGILVRGNPPDKARLAELAARYQREMREDNPVPAIVRVRSYALPGIVKGHYHGKRYVGDQVGRRV